MTKPAAFFDRDGVINEYWYNSDLDSIDTPYSEDQIKFNFGIFDTLKAIEQLGYQIIIVSNQPGAAIEKTSEESIQKVRTYINNALADNGVHLTADYYCLHHPFGKNPKLGIVCDCRKPKTGLIRQAVQEKQIDLSKSWLIGDGINDVLCGKLAGCKTILLAQLEQAGYLKLLEEKLANKPPDFLIRRVEEIPGILKNDQS